MYRCPSTGAGNDANNPGKNNSDWPGTTNYYMNQRLTGTQDYYEGKGAAPRVEADLQFPALTIMMGETNRQASTGAVTDDEGGWGWTDGHIRNLNFKDPNDSAAVEPARKHLDGSNYLFADGHAKWYNYTSLPIENVRRTDKGGPTFCVSANKDNPAICSNR